MPFAEATIKLHFCILNKLKGVLLDVPVVTESADISGR